MSISVRNQSGTLERVAGFADTDAVLSATSKNPIQNKSVYAALEQKIEKTVDDLVNYYTTAQVYNKTEIRDLIGAINTLTISVVSTLPISDISSTTIYFVGPTSGTYDEYVYVNNAWVKIGDTQIDLSDYVTSADLTMALQDYYTKTATDAIFDNYYTKAEVNTLIDSVEVDIDDAISNTSTNPVQNKVIKAALDDKQDNIFIGTKAEWEALTAAQKAKYMLVTLTDDGDYVGNITDNIISGEMSAVTSNAVYSGLAGKQNTLTFDTTPTSGSRNPATSGGIYTALGGKQDDLNRGEFTGNIDTLHGITTNGCYWVNISHLPSQDTGALPFSSGYFWLMCSTSSNSLGTVQIAVPFYSTIGDTVSSGQMYYRTYANSKWYSWRRVYDSTETTSAITSAIAALDFTAVGGSGKYISAIKQDNGKISATATSLSTSVTKDSSVPITSGGVYSAIAALDVSSVGGSGKYISAISEADGKISATATSISTTPTKDSVYPITSGAVYSKFDNIQSYFTVGNVYKDNISISKDSVATITLNADTKTGYKPLGIVGYDINQASSSGYGLSQCTVIAVRLNGSNAYAQVYNRMTDHAAKIKMTFYVLYAKSSS